MQVRFITFVAFLVALSFAQSAFAGSATLSWDPNTESDLAGYKIYYGTSPRTSDCPPGGYPASIDAGTPPLSGNKVQYVVGNLSDGTRYYFSITAYDTSGNQSCFSSQVDKLVTQAQSFAIGDRVRTTATINVRSSASIPPAAASNILGTQPLGALGTISGGPQTGSNYTWWNLNFDNPPDGWAAQDFLTRIAGAATSTPSSTLPSATCTRLRSTVDRLRARLVDLHARIRTSEDTRHDRFVNSWTLRRDRELASITSFETKVRNSLILLESRLRTDQERQAFATFRVSVESLLTARRGALTTSLTTFYNGAVQAVDRLRGIVQQSLPDELGRVDALIQSTFSQCGGAVDERTSQANFFTSYREIAQGASLTRLTAWRTFLQDLRALLLARRSADSAAHQSYSTGYRTAWIAYQAARRGTPAP